MQSQRRTTQVTATAPPGARPGRATPRVAAAGRAAPAAEDGEVDDQDEEAPDRQDDLGGEVAEVAAASRGSIGEASVAVA